MTYIHVEVFIASQILRGQKITFSPVEIKNFIKNEFNDDRPGIVAHISSVCVANAPLNHPKGYNYLWSVGEKKYRVFNPKTDKPEIGRENDITCPELKDIPQKFRYLLENVGNVSEKETRQIRERSADSFESFQDKEKIEGGKSFRSTASFGKRQEFIAFGELLRRGHDVYMTLVDDQQIDCVIRQEKDGNLRYLDIQVKARSKDAKNPGRFAAMEIRNPRENFYFIFYSESADTYWVIPSLDLIKESNQIKSGKNKGKYSITFARSNKKEVKPRPRFCRYENAFDLLDWH